MEDVITNLQRKDDKIFITFKDFPEAIRKEERVMNFVRNLSFEYT